MAAKHFQNLLPGAQETVPALPKAGTGASKEGAKKDPLKSPPSHGFRDFDAMNSGAKKRLSGLQRERAA